MEKITKSSDKVLIDPNEPLILPDGTALVGRVEWFLYALCCLDYQNLPTPMSRIEEFANALITGEIPNIQPQSRAEQFFLAILDGNISDLPQPQSRSEVLLDKLARGEFDLSDVEPIQSHYELLLAYLIKNGGIGNIDYVLYEFSEAMKTMYNTVEKPFKSLELSGNTLVNCVLEDTENDDYTSFDEDYSGTSFTINGTSEGAIKSAILRGQTLVNIVNFEKSYFRTTGIINSRQGCTINFSTATTGKFNLGGKISLLKTDTKYLLKVKLECENKATTYVYLLDEDNNKYIMSNTSIKDNNYSYKFTTPSTLGNTIKLGFIRTADGGEETITASVLLIEHQEGMENWDIPYFTDMQSVKMPVLTTVGKNLFDGEIEIGSIDGSGNMVSLNTRIRSTNHTKVSPLTKYYLKCFDVNYVVKAYYSYDKNKKFIEQIIPSNNYFTTKENCRFIKFIFSKKDNTPITESNQLIMLSYNDDNCEPYKSNILTVNEDVALRSNGNICDELNLLTGQLTQRIDEDGEVLSQEVIKTVDLNVVDQNNTKIDKIHVFNETTHVNASSDELTPTVNIGKSVSYPTIIKPNTKYTIDLKRNDKPLTVNLGGTEVTFASGETRKTITTPSTLTNDKLSYYGIGAKCNEIMLIEGEIERNIDYFTGMQSVVMQNQMPILSTVGKNLFGGELEIGSLSSTGNPINDDNRKRSKDFFPFKGDVAYVIMNVEQLYFYDENKNFISRSANKTDVSPTNTCFIKVRTTGSTEVQIEKGTVATSYEPHKSSILSCNDDVTLRGIGDVQDTLDCLTGEVTERIKTTTLDKFTKWNTHPNVSEEFSHFTTNVADISTIPHALLCDLFPAGNIIDVYNGTSEGLYHSGNKYLHITIKTDKLSENNANGLNQYLKDNIITIQYPLETDSIKTVDLNVVDQDGNTIPKIKSYNGVTHLEVTVPKQSLLPNVSAEVATDNSKDMSSLTTKHQEISEAQSTIEDNIQSQSDEIDTALMATTEIFESILE